MDRRETCPGCLHPTVAISDFRNPPPSDGGASVIGAWGCNTEGCVCRGAHMRRPIEGEAHPFHPSPANSAVCYLCAISNENGAHDPNVPGYR